MDELSLDSFEVLVAVQKGAGTNSPGSHFHGLKLPVIALHSMVSQLGLPDKLLGLA